MFELAEPADTRHFNIPNNIGEDGAFVWESHIKRDSVSAEGYAYISLGLPIQREHNVPWWAEGGGTHLMVQANKRRALEESVTAAAVRTTAADGQNERLTN